MEKGIFSVRKKKVRNKGVLYIMYKEFIIIIVVIALIVGLDIITNNYTKDTVNIISNELEVLKEHILKEDKEKAEVQMKKVNDKWEERYNLLAFYIEHDELEKVETEITRLAADLSVEEYKHCISELDTTIFILEHIQEKEEFHFRSIF